MITLTREEVQLVMDALGSCEEDWIPDGEWETRVDQYDHKLVAKALVTLRARLAQPEKEQEPVAKVRIHKTGGNAGISWSAAPVNDFDSLPLLQDGALLYTATPQREWVGLTDEEMQYLWGRTTPDDLMSGGFDFADAIEAKLKEKNR